MHHGEVVRRDDCSPNKGIGHGKCEEAELLVS